PGAADRDRGQRAGRHGAGRAVRRRAQGCGAADRACKWGSRTMTIAVPPYNLGHSEHEVERLRIQARQLEPVTRHYLREAGIAPGMRVLDIGSGAGDVALLAAELVGPEGEVVGIDRSADVLEVARARVGSQRNISFRQGNPLDLALEPD